jgi:hypothetical protein
VSAVLPASNSIQVGSVAGTITVKVTQLSQIINGQSVTIALPSPAPSIAITVPILPPSVSSVKIINVTGSGFTVDVVASSTPRNLSAATFAFIAASGAQLNGTSFSISGSGNALSTAATTWFASSGGQTSGGTFDLQIPITFSGSTNAIGSVSVQLTNSTGSSASVSGTR